ncbi:MAG: hypothetical protein GY924_27325, partial [Planctomycetaceae bacterium]|nr:hypothetical protein [Planctomycetaceae bacterium]
MSAQRFRYPGISDEKKIMKKFQRITILFALLVAASAVFAETTTESAAAAPAKPAKPAVCFESRKGSSEVTQREIEPDLPNVKCSPTTGAVLWWGDPYDG